MKVNIGKGGIKSFKKKCSIVLGKSKSFFVEIYRLEQKILKTFTHTQGWYRGGYGIRFVMIWIFT